MNSPKTTSQTSNARIPVLTSLRAEDWEIIGLYFFLMAGSLWHVLGVLQSAMSVLSGPVVVMIALWIAYRYDQVLRRERSDSAHRAPLAMPQDHDGTQHNGHLTAAARLETSPTQARSGQALSGIARLHQSSITVRFHSWNLAVGVLCFALEYVGVKTGMIFGKYQYMDVWVPALNGVPLAISFAWLGMLLSSFAVVQRALASVQSPWLRAFCVALCMTVFDMFMEPVSVKLHYWHWLEATGNSFIVAPLQNYLAWFGNSFLLAYCAVRLGLFQTQMPRVAWHGYWAQLLYFSIIALAA
ncbi:MAG: carotenoid biosynthesis protein [Candidatus Kapaibacterium sp.]|nr:MAG: carotenoid biosynthesis protein [Candidatus Kapabacteria bacterium]